MTDINETRHLTSGTRLICFISGLMIASYSLVIGFDLSYHFPILFLGYDFGTYTTIVIVVLMSVVGGWLIKMGITGKTGL